MPKTAKNERAEKKLEEKIKGRLELPVDEGWGSRFAKWMQRNLTSIILPVLAIIVLIGGIYLYTSQRGAPVVPSQELDAELGLDIGKGQISKPTEEPKAQPEPPKQEPKEELGLGGPAKELPEVFTLQAQKGEGITHLARKALSQYLELAPDKPSLSPEHKIYIEDYIRTRPAPTSCNWDKN